MAAQADHSRYVALLERAKFELKLALDLAAALGLPYNRRARLLRAQRELNDELQASATGAQRAELEAL